MRLFSIWKNQQDQIMTGTKTGLHQPVRFPAKTPRPVSSHRVSKPSGKSKANPVVGQIILQYKKFRAPAAKPPALAKNLFDLVPSL
jgi:hypothetical protein